MSAKPGACVHGRKDELVKDLSVRLARLTESGDPAALLAPETARLAAELAAIIGPDPAAAGREDAVPLRLLADVHLARCQVPPADDDQDDLWAGLAWSAALLSVSADLVPEQVRVLVAEPPAAADVIARDASDRGSLLCEGYQRTGSICLLRLAVTWFEAAASAVPAGHPDRLRHLSNLGAALGMMFEHTGSGADQDEAVRWLSEAVAAAGPGDPDRASCLSNLGALLTGRFRRIGRPADLDQAIDLYRSAMTSTPSGDPDRLAVLTNLGDALRVRFDHHGRPADLDEAITVCREAAESTPAGEPNWPGRRGNLGRALLTRFEHGGPQADLNEAVEQLSLAVAAAPPAQPDRHSALSSLGNALRARFEQDGNPADLDQAVTCLRAAASLLPAGHPGRPVCLSSLGVALEARFGATGQLADLDQAITSQRDAVAAAPAGHPELPAMLSNLGASLVSRFQRTGRREDLDEAVTRLTEATTATPAGHPDQAGRLSNLAGALRARFDRDGRQADVDLAIAQFTQAVAVLPAGHPDLATVQSNLGDSLHARFGRTGQDANLDQAIEWLSRAAEATPPGHPTRPGRLSNLGAALRTRFERAGQRADIDQAVAVTREAVGATPVGHPDRPGRELNLGAALQTRFGRDGDQQDLDEAITCYRAAVDATPAGDPRRPRRLSNLGGALHARFEHAGREADLDQAVTASTEAVDATLEQDYERPRRLSNLGAALHAQFGHTGDQTDLDKAIACYRQVIDATVDDHPDLAVYLSNLGGALYARFEHTGEQADLDQALDALRRGAAVKTAPPGRRAAAARLWGLYALSGGLPGAALAGYTAATELLPSVAWHGLDQATREHHLRQWAGLAPDAAAAAIAAGDPVRAVELLEAGRSVLWAQTLQLRANLAQLREQAPVLSAKLEAARAVLAGPPPAPVHPAETAGQGVAAEQQMLATRRQAASDWDAAVTAARQIPGFEHFLLPVPFADLRAAASDGPIVIVNISRHGSHALIIPDPAAEPPVLLIDLPAASADAASDQAVILLEASLTLGGDWAQQELSRHAVFNVLAWCWDAITAPVLAALDRAAAPSIPRTPQAAIEDWPRIWWCPTGPATFLPLHAAGRHPRTSVQYTAMGDDAAEADSVAGRVVCSYTQTLSALNRARARPAAARARQLAVGMPRPPSYAPAVSQLPAVTAELEAVRRYLPVPGQATHLVGPAATREAVLAALPDHSWLHLACHGIQHQADASRSAFLLHDQPLTLAALTQLSLPDMDLAYLAACQTAAGDLRLPDEGLHLAGVLQLAGYRHVLATLWNISDDVAPGMADITYAQLCPHGQADAPDADRAPYALHQAVTALRRAYPAEPLLWAPYVHLGP
jgi:tetratricopeptide (TPR) repeat protein